MRFGDWLGKVLGVKTIPWEVQVGCGDPHDARPRDVCISAEVAVHREVSIGVVMRVGTVERLEWPIADLLFHERSDGSKFGQFDSLCDLAEFAADFVRNSPDHPVP